LVLSAVGVAIGAPPASGQPSPNLFVQMLPLLAICAIFYVFVIHPTKKKQRALQSMIESLKPGDRVITSSGMHGTVVALSEDIVQLRIAENVKVDFSKSAIVGKKE